MKRANILDYNGPKAVRDHGRVATREQNSAAGDVTLTLPLAVELMADVDRAEGSAVNLFPFPVDSGFDLPGDSRAADEGTHSSRVIVPSDRKITKEEYDKYCARLFEVSSGGAEITP